MEEGVGGFGGLKDACAGGGRGAACAFLPLKGNSIIVRGPESNNATESANQSLRAASLRVCELRAAGIVKAC